MAWPAKAFCHLSSCLACAQGSHCSSPTPVGIAAYTAFDFTAGPCSHPNANPEFHPQTSEHSGSQAQDASDRTDRRHVFHDKAGAALGISGGRQLGVHANAGWDGSPHLVGCGPLLPSWRHLADLLVPLLHKARLCHLCFQAVLHSARHAPWLCLWTVMQYRTWQSSVLAIPENASCPVVLPCNIAALQGKNLLARLPNSCDAHVCRHTRRQSLASAASWDHHLFDVQPVRCPVQPQYHQVCLCMFCSGSLPQACYMVAHLHDRVCTPNRRLMQ